MCGTHGIYYAHQTAERITLQGSILSSHFITLVFYLLWKLQWSVISTINCSDEIDAVLPCYFIYLVPWKRLANYHSCCCCCQNDQVRSLETMRQDMHEIIFLKWNAFLRAVCQEVEGGYCPYLWQYEYIILVSLNHYLSNFDKIVENWIVHYTFSWEGSPWFDIVSPDIDLPDVVLQDLWKLPIGVIYATEKLGWHYDTLGCSPQIGWYNCTFGVLFKCPGTSLSMVWCTHWHRAFCVYKTGPPCFIRSTILCDQSAKLNQICTWSETNINIDDDVFLTFLLPVRKFGLFLVALYKVVVV